MLQCCFLEIMKIETNFSLFDYMAFDYYIENYTSLCTGIL